MPLLGFGVYQNYDAKTSVLEAFRAGYRCVFDVQYPKYKLLKCLLTAQIVMSTRHKFTETKHKWLKPFESRGWIEERCLSVRSESLELDYSRFLQAESNAYFIIYIATKCVSKTHGYESTLKGVDESLRKMKFGESWLKFRRPYRFGF